MLISSYFIVLIVSLYDCVSAHHSSRNDPEPEMSWRRKVIQHEPTNQLEYGAQMAVKRAQQSTSSPQFMVSPISGQLISLSAAAPPRTPIQVSPFEQCRQMKVNLELKRDQLEPLTRQLVRTCRGIVSVNRCDGYCTSSVQPSVKSASGIVKSCHCCNEESLKRRFVKLTECYSALGNLEPNGFLEVPIEEPIGCQCRSCSINGDD